MVLLTALALALLAPASPAPADGGCVVPLVVRTAAGPGIELMPVAEGATEALSVGPESKPVTALLPLSPGLSGNLVRAADRGTLELSCGPDHLRTVLRRPDGTSRSLPDVPRENLRRLALRVSVTTADGHARVFEVATGDVRADVAGPAMDLFRGRVPMEPGDYAITMEARPGRPREAVPEGSVSLVRVEGFLMLKGRIGEGAQGLFVLDLAATRTAIGSEHLPPGVTPEPMTAVEHSESGTRVLEQGPHGAGGEVTSALGIAELESLRLGETTIRGLPVLVVQEMPRIHGREIAGILGLDVLAGSGSISFGYGEAGEAAALVFDPPASGEEPDAVLEFSRASGLLFVEGEIAGVPLSFIADTGARLSFLPPEAARSAGLSAGERSETLRGLDGHPQKVSTTTVPSLRIGGQTFTDLPFAVGDLPVVRAVGVAGAAGILGQPFWSAFREIRVDFTAGTISLFR